MSDESMFGDMAHTCVVIVSPKVHANFASTVYNFKGISSTLRVLVIELTFNTTFKLNSTLQFRLHSTQQHVRLLSTSTQSN
jgi:hypothetical protein